MRKEFMRLASITGLVLALWSTVALAGTDQLVGDLRADLVSVYQAQDYVAWVWDQQGVFGGDAYVAGWFGVNTGVFNGQTYSAQFTQVGILNDAAGPRWFFYSEAGSFGGVTCLNGFGTPAWNGFGCIGPVGPGGLGVGDQRWSKFELVTYGQGFWIARVYDINGYVADVAHANYSGTRIYRAQQTGEEAYSSQNDPRYFMNYYYWHPQYITGSGFADWPASGGGDNNAFWNWSSPGINFCPAVYGGALNVSGDPRFWSTRSGGQTCGPVNPWF